MGASRQGGKRRTYTVRRRRRLAVAPKVVFRALTNASELKAWSGQVGRVEARPGGRFSMFGGWMIGKILEARAPRRLVYTWRYTRWPRTVADSTVFWTITPVPGGTRLSLVHTGLPNKTEWRRHWSGWETHFLGPLARHLERRG